MDIYTLHTTYIKMADDLSLLSKCEYNKRGSLLVKNGSIISTGVYGTPSQMINCDVFLESTKSGISEHQKFEEKWEIESEVNAIARCIVNNISPLSSDLYSSLIPKEKTIKYIHLFGIRRIYYGYNMTMVMIRDETVRNIHDLCMQLNIDIEPIYT